MKKFTSIFTAILLMGTVLFFACKKDEPAPVVVTDCSTLATTLAPEIAAAQTAFTAYSTLPNSANCNKLKTAATTLQTKASVCPAVIALPNIQVLITAAAALPCTAP